MAMSPPKCKKRTAVIPRYSKLPDEVLTNDYWSMQAPIKLTSVKTKCSWSSMQQGFYDKAKTIIKQDACKKFYDVSKP